MHSDLHNLHTLLAEDSDARSFFLSLPVRIQMTVHRENDTIKTPEQLHRYVDFLTKTNGHVR